jgi:hypothetical protein
MGESTLHGCMCETDFRHCINEVNLCQICKVIYYVSENHDRLDRQVSSFVDC